MGWQRLVGSLEFHVSFAKKTYTNRALFQKRPENLGSLLPVVTALYIYIYMYMYMYIYIFSIFFLLTPAHVEIKGGRDIYVYVYLYLYFFYIFFYIFSPHPRLFFSIFFLPTPAQLSYPPTPAGNVRFFWEFGNFYI